MKRVTHPKCCGCGASNPDFESTRYNLRVCYRCLTECASWLREQGCLVPNPLIQELFDGVFSGGTVPLANQYTVVVLSDYSASFIIMEKV